ncbi:MAG: hypothetical protein IT340_18125 [Chloroflexi bacterium]|nr:hypothetical protein [Chloroflexota bacterium]
MPATCPCQLHRCWRGCQRLAVALVAWICTASRVLWPAWARTPIAVQCGDAAARRATTAVLRRALRDTQRVLGRPPAVPLRLRVLAAAGTPSTFADLGHALAVCQVRAVSGGPRAIVTLATTADDRPVSADQLVVALTATLDWLDGRHPEDAMVWSLPAAPAPASSRLAHDTLRWLPTRSPTPHALPLVSSTDQPSHQASTAAPTDDPLGLSGA